MIQSFLISLIINILGVPGIFCSNHISQTQDTYINIDNPSFFISNDHFSNIDETLFSVEETFNIADPDSTDFSTLDAKLDEYLAALEREPIDVKCSEVDFILSACTDSTVLARVANKVYNHYVDSKLMGDEAVAIHVFDTWFADKKISMGSDDAYFAAQFFATANRNSLLGCPAPPLTLYTPDNAAITIFENVPDRYTVLYFYDTDCSKCLVESITLRGMFERHDYAVDLCAVYVGSNEESWAQYRAARLDIDSPNLRIIHLWDPDLSSGFTLQYGVIGTPKMFLVDPSGTIVGRGLDTSSLEQLLDAVLAPKTLEYGSDESKTLYDKTFADTVPTDCEAVSEVAAHIQSLLLPGDTALSGQLGETPLSDPQTVRPRGDTLLFKQMTGDLLYYLTGRKEAQFKCGAPAFIDGYILSRPDIWNSADDSIKVVSLALFLKDLMSLCPEGSTLPALSVPAEILSAKKSRTGTVRLNKLKNCAIVFHTEGCKICQAEIAAAHDLLASGATIPNTGTVLSDGTIAPGTGIRPKKIILIDMDEIWNSGGDLPDALMQQFDLSTLPFILVLDSSGRVARKYATLQ